MKTLHSIKKEQPYVSLDEKKALIYLHLSASWQRFRRSRTNIPAQWDLYDDNWLTGYNVLRVVEFYDIQSPRYFPPTLEEQWKIVSRVIVS